MTNDSALPTEAWGANSPEHAKQAVAEGKVTWGLTVLAGVARLLLITLGIYAVYGYYVAVAHPQAWWMSLNLTNFTMVLTADVGVMVLLHWLLKREGLTFGDLIHRGKQPLWREILVGLGFFVLLMVGFYLANIVGYLAAYGPSVFTTPPAFDATNIPQTPLWVLWWTLLVLPITVAVAEELLYRGYLQPRLIALTNSRWLGILITALFFGLQHIVLPLFDVQTSISRFIGTFIIGLLFGLLYQQQKRLLPLIIAHWLIDVVGLGLFPLLARFYSQ